MDLAKIKPAERQIEILHPATKELIGLRVGIVHLSDDRLKKIKRNFADERYRLEARNKTFKAEIAENNEMELIYSAMTGWEFYSPSGEPEDTLSFNGETPAFGKRAVLEMLEALPWMKDQLAEEISNTEAFFPR